MAARTPHEFSQDKLIKDLFDPKFFYRKKVFYRKKNKKFSYRIFCRILLTFRFFFVYARCLICRIAIHKMFHHRIHLHWKPSLICKSYRILVELQSLGFPPHGLKELCYLNSYIWVGLLCLNSIGIRNIYSNLLRLSRVGSRYLYCLPSK